MNMKQAIYVYETGIDDNRDKHCDYCGWFVNEYERHRARLMRFKGAQEVRPEWSRTDFHLERMSAEEFSEIFIVDNPYSRPDWNPERYAPIRSYSENAPEGLSCMTVNNYLRFGVVPEGLSEGEIASYINEMNALIGNFVIGKEATFYRGTRFKPGDPYLQMLVGALEAMKATGKPVKLIEPGFMSLSRSLETAKAYACAKDPELCHVFMSVTLDKGVAAMPLSLSRGTTTKKDDKEVLLESGRACYIIGIEIEPRGNGLYDCFINLLATNRRI